MGKQEYLDFELEIGPGRGRQYPVAVIRSPAGEARETMRFPFGELALQNRLQALKLALLYSGGKRRQRPLPEEQAVQDFGRALFDALLTGEIRSRYDVSVERAAEQDKGLRLKLRIQPPGLAVLPWEFLYDPRQAEYVCLSRNTPVVRYIELPQAIQPLTVTPPLRILGMIASPRDPYLERLDTENEKQRVERAVKDLRVRGLVDLEWLPGQSWRELQRAMRGGPWHIFHFIGHGGFDPTTDEGLIVLADDNGLRDELRATELGRLLANHRSLRLALLNSCEGARGSELDIFSSTASILVRRGIPAVLAMQYEITDHAAIEFARAFYEALADGMPVDAAVAEARVAVSLAVTNTVEWRTPVLYMRAPDGRIFSVEALTPEERAAEAARAEAEARAKREEAERRALEQRQAQLAALYEQATTQLAEQDWAGARELLAQIQEIEPGYRDVAALLDQAQAGQARAEQLAALLAQGAEYLGRGEWSQAAEAYRQALAIVPDHPEALARLAEAERQEQVATLFATAQGHMKAGRWSEAIAGFQAVLKLDPTHAEAARQLAAAQAQLERQQAEERKRREEEARQAELARLYAVANEAAKARNWSKTIESFQAVLKLDANYRDAPARLAQAREAQAAEEAARQQEAQLANLYETARGRVQARDWPEAERLLREIQRVAPSFRDVEALLAQVTSQREREQRLATLYARAEAHYGKGEWAQAVDLYGQVLALESGYRDAKAKLVETQRQRSLTDRYAQALAHLQAQRWQEAIEGFQAVVAIDPHYGDPAYGSAATLLARAQQQEKLAELPAARAPRPTKNLLLWIGGGIGVLVVALVSVLVALRVLLGMFGGNVTTPTPTPAVVQPTKTLVPPTATTGRPTTTSVPPTATSIAPTATQVPATATPMPPTATRPLPTPSPRPGSYGVPLLVAPANGQEFSEATQAIELSWQAVGDLAADEFYDVYLTWRAGGKRVEKHWYTQETRFVIGREYFGLSDDGRYEWNVVVRHGQSPDAGQLSPISEQRFFLWRSRPAPQPTWTSMP
jgi:tetratricopeptide (TPR) repeat protein